MLDALRRVLADPGIAFADVWALLEAVMWLSVFNGGTSPMRAWQVGGVSFCILPQIPVRSLHQGSTRSMQMSMASLSHIETLG